MKHLCKITAAAFLAAVLFSCGQEKSEKQQKRTLETVSQGKEVKVKLVGTLSTRRTFADIQFIDNEKEQNRYLAKQEKSNPGIAGLFTTTDSLLIIGFKRLGLVKEGEFLLSKFKTETKENITFVDSSKQNIFFRFFRDTSTGSIHFKALFPKDSIDIDTKATALQKLDYVFLDVIPGGNKELVFLDDYYIMNGYNFDFMVYEIKSN